MGFGEYVSGSMFIRSGSKTRVEFLSTSAKIDESVALTGRLDACTARSVT